MNRQEVKDLFRYNWSTIFGDEWLITDYRGEIKDVTIGVEEDHCVIEIYGCRKDWFIKGDKQAAKETIKTVFSKLGKVVNLKINSSTVKPGWMNNSAYQAVSRIVFDIR